MAAGGPNKLTLTIKSTSGTVTETFNANNKAQKVLDEAIKHFGLSTGGGVSYILRREVDGRSLDLSEKLEDLGLENGDVILLQTSQAQDG